MNAYTRLANVHGRRVPVDADSAHICALTVIERLPTLATRANTSTMSPT